MDPYKSIFKTLLCTDNYMTKTALSNYIKSYIDSTKENSVDQILHRRFNIFVKEGLLEKYHNGTEVIYKRSELARNIHKKFGTELLMKAYDIIQLSKNKDAQTIIRNLAGPFIILCQSGKIQITQGKTHEDRNRCRAICS